jgi:hypothetical protein
MVKFADKYPEKFSSAPTLIKEAAKSCGVSDTSKLLAANGSWYYVIENGKELAKTSDFEFLMVEGKAPVQFNVSAEAGKFGKPEKKDLTEELGEMEEEAAMLGKMESKLLSEAKAVEIASDKLANARKAAPHLRITMVSFSVSDQSHDVPAWRIEANNWPLTSYLKSREKEKKALVVIDALSGKVLEFKGD